MGGGISKMAKQELVATIRDRYRQASKKDKGRILDEFTAITGHHRKHGIRLLGGTADNKGKQALGRRIYDEAVREAVIVVWEASDRICGKRLKAALPNFVDSMERHGHLSLDPAVRERLHSASAATLDRLLKPIRSTAGSRRKRRRRTYMGSQIPVRTYNDWNWPPPGFLEIDLVAHCGGTLSGSFIHSLVATDICTGWTEAVPLLAREQSLVVEGLKAIAGQTMVHLYQAVRLHVNYFQPSFKLLEKIRDGARVIKRYSPPATPCDRLMQGDTITAKTKEELNVYRAGLDPVALLRSIREAQSAMAAMSSPQLQGAPHSESIDRLLARLPSLWQQGEARPTHKARVRPPRHWRTRKDPFEGVWCDVLLWLQKDPDTNAKDLLAKLREAYPGRFGDAHLRTLQRRVKDWRGVMAKRLVYSTSDEPASERSEKVELVLVGVGNKG